MALRRLPLAAEEGTLYPASKQAKREHTFGGGRLRVFIGLRCPPAAVAGLTEVLAALPERDWRCVAPAQRHLTVRFLGEQPESLVDALIPALTRMTMGLGAFHLRVVGLGAFPTTGHPETVWAGCSGAGATAVQHLFAKVEAAVAGLGVPAESSTFRPHVTLARRRREADRRASAALIRGLCTIHLGRDWGTVDVAQLVIFRSELHGSGARYTPLAHVPLASQAGTGLP